MRSILISLFAAGAVLSSAQSDRRLTKTDIDQMMKQLSNWNRWGQDDQIGALHLITPEKRKQAAALVHDGASVSLARDVETQKAPDNPQPFRHDMTATATSPGQFVMDNYSVSYHGYAHTHMDALCHMSYEGKMFNGYPRSTVTAAGAAQLSILGVKNGIFTRGILMDIPALKGLPYLEPGTPIYPADLDAWEKKAGLKVGSGDVVFIRTGRWARRREKGPWDAGKSSAGLYASCARWLKQRDVAMIGSDAASDVMPSGVDGVSQPIHQLMLVSMGVMIFDNCDLEALSAAAAQYHRWAFLLTASPLAVTGGTGSPLNPIATF